MSGLLKNPNDSHIILGSTSVDNTYCRGILDSLRIYNRTLTETEVAALYEFERVKP